VIYKRCEFTVDYLLFDLIKFLYLALRLGGRGTRWFAPGGVPAVGGDVTASPGIPNDVTGVQLGDFASARVLLLCRGRAVVKQLFADRRRYNGCCGSDVASVARQRVMATAGRCRRRRTARWVALLGYPHRNVDGYLGTSGVNVDSLTTNQSQL